MRLEQLSQIKAGDRVTLETGSLRSPRQKLATVARVTATQIILDRAANNRFYRDKGRAVGMGIGAPYIVGIATPREIEEIESREQAEDDKHRRFRDEQEAYRQRMQALDALFPPQYGATVRCEDNRLEVTLALPDDEQVRQLARKLSEA
jgi:hypothetical protein